ncbi:MAG: class F sortase [Clostridia bacterium]|nr:class F sortase [Clostridia bacterium]
MFMKRKVIRSEKRKAFDLGVYCIAVLLLFFAVVLFMRGAEYLPQEVYNEPPPVQPVTGDSPSVPHTGTSTSPTYAPVRPFNPPQSPNSVSDDDEDETEFSEPLPPDFEFKEGELYPVKLYFVERKISCDVWPVVLNDDNKMDTIRSPYKAGWLYVDPYVVPGDTGKAIIAGHNSWKGRSGTFSVLRKMDVGEKIAVELSDGYSRYFRVDSVTECSYDDNTVMEPVYDKPVLVLITCKGDWSDTLRTSRTRVIVTCSPCDP